MSYSWGRVVENISNCAFNCLHNGDPKIRPVLDEQTDLLGSSINHVDSLGERGNEWPKSTFDQNFQILYGKTVCEVLMGYELIR